MQNSPLSIAFYGTPPDEQEYLQKRFAEANMPVTASYNEHGINPQSLPAKNDAAALGVFVDSVVNGPVMDAFPKLKLIVTLSTGFDHIDLKEAAKRGITVCNVPSYGENTVAEFAFGLILTLSRKIYAAADQIKETGGFGLEGLRGFDLEGKTIGVIGTGKIGKHSIVMARGFGMKIVAYDPFPNEKLQAELGFKYVPLDELLEKSDVITLHVPYSEKTHHLIDEKAFARMKPTAILINTSRGGIVDTDALVKALNEKRIAGAGLDVLEEENALKDEKGIANIHGDKKALRTINEDHALMKMSNVIVTPHNAFNTDEALRRILDTTVDNVKAWAEGKPANVVKA